MLSSITHVISMIWLCRNNTFLSNMCIKCYLKRDDSTFYVSCGNCFSNTKNIFYTIFGNSFKTTYVVFLWQYFIIVLLDISTNSYQLSLCFYQKATIIKRCLQSLTFVKFLAVNLVAELY